MDNAQLIFKAIKTKLADARKYNKDKAITAWGRHSQMVELSYDDVRTSKFNPTDGTYTRGETTYNIMVDGKAVVRNLSTISEVSSTFSKVANLLNEQKKVKGWGGLNFVFEKQTHSFGGFYNTTYVNVIPKVCLADAPCKEYNSLMNFINKYGKFDWGNKQISNYEFFSANMGGKRGRLWDEYGERIFLDNKPKRCARALEELRKARTSKDTLTIKRGEEDYIDEIDRKYSEYHEVECEGEKRRYFIVTIKTPMGKVKYEEKIY